MLWIMFYISAGDVPYIVSVFATNGRGMGDVENMLFYTQEKSEE